MYRRRDVLAGTPKVARHEGRTFVSICGGSACAASRVA